MQRVLLVFIVSFVSFGASVHVSANPSNPKTEECLGLFALLSQMKDSSLGTNYPELFPPMVSKEIVMFEGRFGSASTRLLLELLQEVLNPKSKAPSESEQSELGVMWVRAVRLYALTGVLNLSDVHSRCKDLCPTPAAGEALVSRFKSLSEAVQAIQKEGAPTFFGTHVVGLLYSTTLDHANYRIAQINTANKKRGLQPLTNEQMFKVKRAFFEGLGFTSFDWDPLPEVDIEVARLFVLDHHGRHDEGKMMNTTRKLIREFELGLQIEGPRYIRTIKQKYRHYTTNNAFDSLSAVDPIIYSLERADNFYAAELLRVALSPSSESLGFDLSIETVAEILGEQSMTFLILRHRGLFQNVVSAMIANQAPASGHDAAKAFEASLAKYGYALSSDLIISFTHLFDQRVSDLQFDFAATAYVDYSVFGGVGLETPTAAEIWGQFQLQIGSQILEQFRAVDAATGELLALPNDRFQHLSPEDQTVIVGQYLKALRWGRLNQDYRNATAEKFRNEVLSASHKVEAARLNVPAAFADSLFVIDAAKLNASLAASWVIPGHYIRTQRAIKGNPNLYGNYLSFLKLQRDLNRHERLQVIFTAKEEVVAKRLLDLLNEAGAKKASSLGLDANLGRTFMGRGVLVFSFSPNGTYLSQDEVMRIVTDALI